MISPSPSDDSPTAPKPSFGHAALAAFALAPERIHLNHGSFGAVPKCVLQEQDRLRAELERDPTGFFKDIYPRAIRESAGVAARHFGGSPSDWVFCENATAAVNSVLASLPLQPGDELLTASHAYGAVLKAMQLWTARKSAVVRVADLPAIVESESQIADAIDRAFTSRTRLLVTDHITSPTAIVFPVREIVRRARAHGIPVLVDGAHAPGQLEFSVPEIGADWYTGNAHKWFFAPRGCGLLWTSPRWQQITRPAVLSHGTNDGYTDAFDWIGTRDVTPWLCLDAAASAFDAFGGHALMARNRSLAAHGGALIARTLNRPLTAPSSMRAAMASIHLSDGATPEQAANIRATLRDCGFVVATSIYETHLFLRVSAQAYNQFSDFENLADTLATLGFS